MKAPEKLVAWFQGAIFRDRGGRLPAGVRLQYHSRSDEHSKKLGEFIVDDLLDSCAALRTHALAGEVVWGINIPFTWPNGKTKTLDLAFGIASEPNPPEDGRRIRRLTGRADPIKMTRLLIACEEKATMTEHGKSQPRIFSELNDAHTIVHQGSRDTIAAGVTMLNIAPTFVSPLRQRPDQPVVVSKHRQPDVTARMINHLRRLPLRNEVDETGLDAYCTFVVDLNNQGHVAIHTDSPAPQQGDPDHYDTFIARIARLYSERYSNLQDLPPVAGQSLETALRDLARRYPDLLPDASTLMSSSGLPGADELAALIASIKGQARSNSEPQE